MTPITKFNHSNIQDIRVAINEALGTITIGEVTFKLGRCKFGATSARFTLTVTTENHTEVVANKYSHLFECLENKRYQFIDYNSRAPRYPYIVLDKFENQRYKMSLAGAQKALKDDGFSQQTEKPMHLRLGESETSLDLQLAYCFEEVPQGQVTENSSEVTCEECLEIMG